MELQIEELWIYKAKFVDLQIEKLYFLNLSTSPTRVVGGKHWAVGFIIFLKEIKSSFGIYNLRIDTTLEGTDKLN